jgi:phage N-6-adenine-methyltransferase
MSKDNWGTPLPVYMPLDEEFNFQADLCASESNAKHPYYLTEADNALGDLTPSRLALSVMPGSYTWCNPPYSAIGPWVDLAATLQRRGIGTVMLVMADTSVGWYYQALQHCNEIREIVAGRLAFINAASGEPVSGNNKGSLLLIFDPYGRQGNPRRSYITRDELLARGHQLMTEPGHLMALYAEPTPEYVEPEPKCVEPEPKCVELKPEQPSPALSPDLLWHHYQNGDLKADNWNLFLCCLVVLFGLQPEYSHRQVCFALTVADQGGENDTAAGLIPAMQHNIASAHMGLRCCLDRLKTIPIQQQAEAIAHLVATNEQGRKLSASEAMAKMYPHIKTEPQETVV